MHQFGKKDITMFMPISSKMERQLCTVGKIYISASSGWETTPVGNSVPHNIRYREISAKIYDDMVLYTCYITISTQKVTFSNLKKCTFIADSFYSNENTMYVLLKLALEEIINFAKKTGRKYLDIISDLPHIAEHFVDLGFVIKKGHGNFVGKKVLKGEYNGGFNTTKIGD